MRTNFQEWANFYHPLLQDYYWRFSSLFPRDEAPSYNRFLVYCWQNTDRHYNRRKMRWETPIHN